MPFPPSGTYPLSSKDVVSFAFDEPNYDLDKPIFIDPDNPKRHYTYRTAKETVQKLIAGLHAAGLQHGDSVCIHSFNSLLYPLLILAIIGAGGYSVGTNPSYTQRELSHGVKVAKIRFVLAEPEILPNMLKALKENGIDVGKRLFVLDTMPDQQVPEGMQSWKSLLEHGTKEWIRFNNENKSRDTTAQLYYTSGTTGLPKCAMTSHRNLIAEHQLFFENNPRSYPIRVVLCMPFYHVGVAPQVFVSVIKEGREGYVMRRFELESYLRHHAKYQITETFMVPPMVISIVTSGLADPNSPKYKPEFSLKSVRNGTTGAAPCSGDMQQRFHSLLGDGATFGQVWGMTETTSMFALVPWDVARKCGKGELEVWGNVGKPLPCMSAKLCDADGNDVTESGKGEFCVKGPTVVRGYFENPKATSESWDADGYFHSGDVMEVDKHGLMYVVERLKELIKVRGFQVAPAELEGALTEHPDIVDAAVIGIEESKEVEHPKAYIVRREGSNLTEEDIHAHMKERLARYKQLTGGVEFIDAIPKLPSGKILKRVLRDEAKKKQRAASGSKL